jgi:hypothetical protein
MTFASFFKISSYSLISAGFLAVAVTGSVHLVILSLFASVLAASWFLDTIRIRKSVPLWILNCLLLAYIPFFVLDYQMLSRSFPMAVLHLLLFAAAVKLLTRSKDRDYFFLYLISFAELLAAATITVNIAFGCCFLLFLLSGVSTLILFEMRRSNARIRDKANVLPAVVSVNSWGTGWELFSPFPAGLLLGLVIGMTLLILAFSVPLFLLLPRLSIGPYRQPPGNTRFISGFSNRVELGQIGTIKQSDAIVMRVKISKPPSELPPDLKWRGLAFDYFDGRSWSRSDLERHSIPTQGRYYKLENFAQGTDWLNQVFFIEALSTDVVFAAHKALAVSIEAAPLRRDTGGSLYTASHAKSKLMYLALSDPIRPDPAKISDRSPIPLEIIETYLQLPSGDPRVAVLARQITRTGRTNYEKAKMLEHYLRSNYAYSLQLRGKPASKEPLAMFLFDVRRGHCEYFASAMTIMLRHLAIPARLVNGFRTGEYNSIGGNWIVRQYNAHSWAEAYFPPYGWVEFDPTPPDPQRHRTALARAMVNIADAIDLWWWEGVVDYDLFKQYRVIVGLRSSIDDFQETIRQFLTLAYEKSRKEGSMIFNASLGSMFGEWILWISASLVVALLLQRPVRRRISILIHRLLFQGSPRAMAASFYGEALELLAAKGIVRRQGQTPLEFAKSLEDHPAGIPFLALTHIYNFFRFGPPGTAMKHVQAEKLLRSLRESLHHKQP